MSVKERQLKEIQKYQVAMREIARRCDENEGIGYKSLQYDFHLQPVAVKALCNMGYMDKIGYGKYVWKATRTPNPMMARRLYEWMREYFLSTKTRQREMESETLYEDDNCDVDQNEDELPIETQEIYTPEPIESIQEECVEQTIEQPSPRIVETTKTIKIFGITIGQVTTKSIRL